MRTTLACQWCRRSKIKCRHDGMPPCQACTSNPIRQCVLSVPKAKKKVHERPQLTQDARARVCTQNRPRPDAGPGTFLRDHPSHNDRNFDSINTNLPCVSTIMMEASDPALSSAPPNDPLLGLDRKVVLNATEIFQQRFTMFSFLHGPTLLKLIYGENPLDLRFCGIMALCARFIPELIHEHGGPLAASEHFAAYLRHKITAQIVISLDITIAQTLLLLSFHDWGSGKGGQSWTYNGMATRACSVTLARLSRSKTHRPAVLQTQVEEARRTLWSCLMTEAMLGCGDLRSLSFHSRMYHVPLPSSDEDFIFGVRPENDLKYLEVLDLEFSDPPKIQRLGNTGFEINFSLIIQGFNIWSEVSRWVSSGQRTQRSPTSRGLSWRDDSFWSSSLTVLEDWREAQSSRVHFSATDSHLPAFLSRRHGERYAFVNLIYYSTSIFLHRECLPLIMNGGPSQGGSDEANTSAEPVCTNWWETSAEKLAESALNTIHLIRQLLHHGIDLQVPFTCYCVFNATTVLYYAKKWPEIIPGGPNAVELFDWGVEWVSRASEIWEVARVWRTTLMKIDTFHIGPGRTSTAALGPQSSSQSRNWEELRSDQISLPIEGNSPTPLGFDEIQLPHQQYYATSDGLSSIWDSLIAHPVHAFPAMDGGFLNFDSINSHIDTR